MPDCKVVTPIFYNNVSFNSEKFDESRYIPAFPVLPTQLFSHPVVLIIIPIVEVKQQSFRVRDVNVNPSIT